MTVAHGGELVALALKAQGVKSIYTLCGGHIAPIYEGCLNQGIHILDFRHEQAAAHAADAHARLTHNIGVAVVTAGPGVTDAVTAVANAYQARSPLVLLGGAAPLKTKGMGALQEIPQTGLFADITKASFTVMRTENLLENLQEAFHLALTGRPGPVFIELPFDVLFNAIDLPATPLTRVQPEPVAPALAEVEAMFALLRAAERPVVVAGSQVYWDEAGAALRQLAEQCDLPIFTNGAGRGALPMNHPNCFKAARGAALKQADVILLIGTPLDFRLKYGKDWAADARLIQIENDPAALHHNRRADVALCASARLVLEALSEGLQGLRYTPWREAVAALEAPHAAQLAAWMALDDRPLNHFRFAAELERILDDETLVIADGGDIVSACAKVLTLTQSGQWLDPGPLGCLGVGAPFAIAAKHLFPQKKVLLISGDGSFGLNGFEFDTAVRFGLPFVCVVGNDAAWGQIRTPQINMVGEARAVATALAPTRYDKVVEALGGYGAYVDDPADLAEAVRRAFESGLPACVNVALDPRGMSKTGASTPYIV
jgi:acetolactate synthase-1/2/3 large subunit